jgi:hypothetical protein
MNTGGWTPGGLRRDRQAATTPHGRGLVVHRPHHAVTGTQAITSGEAVTEGGNSRAGPRYTFNNRFSRSHELITRW